MTCFYFLKFLSQLLFLLQLSILNGVYGGLGQSMGALIGGAMSKQYGMSATRMFDIAS